MRLRGFKATAITGAALLLLGGIAFGAVRVYKNDFSNRGEVKELKLLGKGCKAKHRKKQGFLTVSTETGGTLCRLRLPVQGDKPQPDHIVKVIAKLLPKTDKKVRKKVYLGIRVREGGGRHYELRVFPERRKYSLVRKPGAEGFPVNAKERDVGSTGDKNKLTLRAVGDGPSGKVNSLKILGIEDPAPRDLAGTRVSLVMAQKGKSKKGATAIFDKLSLGVPKP